MKNIIVSKKVNGLVEVSLNRPDMRNAFNPDMIYELTEAFQGFSADESLRCIILKGEGKVFCAGADLAWMQSMVHFTYEQNQKDALKLFGMFESILNCPHPVISLVQGAAFGGALGILASSDLVLSQPDAKFCFSEVKLGIAPAVISSFVLQKVNFSKVQPLMISGKVFSAQEALVSGLVTEISADSSSLENWVQSFLEAAPGAVRSTKELIKKIPTLSWEDQKSLTSSVIAERRVSQEGQEGLKSFLNKTTPSWKK